MKLLLPIILCLALAIPAKAKEPEPAFQPAAGYAVGAVIICVGGYCIYKMVKVCQKAFPPKSTNSPPALYASGSEEYAGAYEYSSPGSCYIPPSLGPNPYENLLINPTTFTLKINVNDSSVETSMTTITDEGTAQTWDQFQSEMAGHGLHLAGHPSPPQFSRNGVPCDSVQVPLEFDQVTGRVTHHTGGYLRRVVIERSPNLVDWSPLLVTDIGVGTGFQVVDTTREGACFYRVTLNEPN